VTAWWITGDTRKVMAQLPAGSVDLCLFSPPFLALRSYLDPDDPAKPLEIGSEANPAEFIDTLLDVTEACARLLAPHGTLCVELGDTYSGSGGAGGDYADDGLRAGQAKFRQERKNGRNDKVEMAAHGIVGTTSGERAKAFGGWPQSKSLALIPEAYRMALAYGRNPHNGRTTDPWRIRNVIRWVRPNPPVGALGDKFRPATSEMVVACKAKDRWFDLDAVRTAHKYDPAKTTGNGYTKGNPSGAGEDNAMPSNPAGAPPLDWWDEIADIYQTAIETCAGDVRDGAKVARSIIAERYGSDAWEISPGGYSGTHYAVFPPELCVKPIEAMCPRRVCRTCSKPSRRLVGEATYHRNDSDKVPARLAKSNGSRIAEGVNQHHNADGANTSVTRQTTTTGWSTCGCPGADGIRLDGYHTGPGWRPGIVLDPFGGSGTTASVASGHSRDSISIDLDRRNADLARDRIGMWFAEITEADIAAGWMPHNPLSR
jgi:site-specific DNA-methyltransferase (adenine-specific)